MNRHTVGTIENAIAGLVWSKINPRELMAIISNKHAGVGVAIAGFGLILFSIHEAREHLEWVHDKLWIAGPMLIVLGLTIVRHPGSGPIGDDNSPALTRRERWMWIIGGAGGLVAGVGWLELLERI